MNPFFLRRWQSTELAESLPSTLIPPVQRQNDQRQNEWDQRAVGPWQAGIDESMAHAAFGCMDVPPPETLALPFGSARVEWRRSTRARRVSLRIDPAGGFVVVTLPSRATRSVGMALLMSHVDWVADRLAALPPAITFEDGSVVPVCGVPHRIRHVPWIRSEVGIRGEAGIRGAVGLRGGAWLLDGELQVAGAQAFIRRRVLDFLKAEARRRIGAMVAAKTALGGVAARRITMKDTSSRWGSCSADKSLSFSWRLVMAPAFVQDYVAAHEVAHLRHMNHGADFWALVDQLTPYTKTAILWLRTEGARLQRIG